MIKGITSKEHIDFLKENKAKNEQVALSTKGKFYGCYIEEKLIGTISINRTKNNTRIKGFYVTKEYRNKGIGENLLQHVLSDKSNFTAFATERSYRLFNKSGFETVNFKNNNVRFMRRNIYVC